MNPRRLPFLLLALALLAVLAGCTVTEGGGAGTFDDGTYPAYKTIKIKLLDKPSTTIKIKDRYDINSDRILFYFDRDIRSDIVSDLTADINKYVTTVSYDTTVIPADQFFQSVIWYETFPVNSGICTTACDTVALMIRNPLVPNVEYRLTLEGLADGNTVQTHPHTLFFDTGDHDDFPNVPYVQQSYPALNQGTTTTYPEPYPPHEILELNFSEPLARFVMVIDGQEKSQLEQIRRYWGEFSFVNPQGQLYNYDTDTQLRIVPNTGLNLNTIYNIYMAAEPPPFDGSTVYRPGELVWFSAIKTPPSQDANGTRLVLTPASSAAVKHEGLFRVSRSSPQPSDKIDSFTLRFKTSRVRIENLVAGYRLQVNPADLPIDWTLPQVAGILAQMDGGTVLPQITAVTLETPGPSGTVFTPATLGTTDGLTLDSFTASYVPIHLAAGSTLSYLKARPTCLTCTDPPGIDLITYILDGSTANLGIRITYPTRGSTFNLARVTGATSLNPNKVWLYVNGIFIAEQALAGGDTTFQFTSVPFEQGENQILVMPLQGNTLMNTWVAERAKFDNLRPYIVDSYPIDCYKLFALGGSLPEARPAECEGSNWDKIYKNDYLVITFSEPLAPQGLAGDTNLNSNQDLIYLLKQSVVEPSRIVEITSDYQTLIIGPLNDLTPLAGGTHYELAIPQQFNRLVNNRLVDLAGNPFDTWSYFSLQRYRLRFDVQTTIDPGAPSPSTIQVYRSNGTILLEGGTIPCDQSIIIDFPEPMNPASVLANVSVLQGTTVVTGTWTVVLQSEYQRYQFTPASCNPDTSYTIKVYYPASDLAGNPMGSDSSSDFTRTYYTWPAGYDGWKPQIDYITLSGIDTLFNCKNDRDPADDWLYSHWPPSSDPCRLAVLPTGFSIDIAYRDAGSGIDPSTLYVFANPPGLDIANRFAADSSQAVFQVTDPSPFYNSTVTLTVSIEDLYGNVSDGATYVFRVAEPSALDATTNDLIPLEATQIIYLDFLQDIWTVTLQGTTLNYYFCPQPCYDSLSQVSCPSPCNPNGGNAVSDFDEELYIYGLNSADGDLIIVPNTAPVQQTINQRVRDLIHKRIKQKLGLLFGIWMDDDGNEVYRDNNSVNIDFRILDDSGQRISLLPSYPPSPDLPPVIDGTTTWLDAPPPFNDPVMNFTPVCFGGKLWGRDKLDVLDTAIDSGASQSMVDNQNDHQNTFCGLIRWTPEDGSSPPSKAACKDQMGINPNFPAPAVLGIHQAYGSITSYRRTGSSLNSSYRLVFDKISPLAGDTLPIGKKNCDPIVLDPLFDRTRASGACALRYDEIMKAIEGFSNNLAVVTAHEMGHSLGLANIETTTNPWPPMSSFGGNAKIGATPYYIFPNILAIADDIGGGHISTINFEKYGFFPGSGTNIMDSANVGGFEAVMSPITGLTTYDKAYLLNRTIYLVDSESSWFSYYQYCVDQFFP